MTIPGLSAGNNPATIIFDNFFAYMVWYGAKFRGPAASCKHEDADLVAS